MSMGGAVGVVITLFDQGILNGTHIAILAPAIYLMGFQVQYMGRIMGPIGTEGRYIPVMIAISVLNAFGAMLVMNLFVNLSILQTLQVQQHHQEIVMERTNIVGKEEKEIIVPMFGEDGQ